MRKFKVDILVRDNRLPIMNQRGENPDFKILDNQDYIFELKKKLLEESQEVLDSNSSDELKEELADVLEVIDHLLDAYNININEVHKIKTQKQEKLGSFSKKIKVLSVSLNDDNKEIYYYLSKPLKYPEIKYES